jgi:anti-sigma factor RsiW
MNCRDADNLIQESLDRSLSVQDRAKLDAHLQDCPSCAKLWAEYRQIAKTARAWLDTAVPESGAGIKTRVLAEIASSPARSERLLPARATLIWTVIAAVAVVVGAFTLLPGAQLPSAAHDAVRLPGVMTILSADLTALRRFGDALAQPPIIPIPSMVSIGVLISAAAANIALARRAARSGHRGTA